jgi:quinol monooxygenase YgiN
MSGMNYPKQSELQHLVFSCVCKEENVQEFIDLVNKNQVATRAEQGTLRCDFMRDKEQKNKFYINDIYLNEEAWATHQATPEFGVLGAFMQSGKLSDVQFIMADSVCTAEYINQSSVGPKDYTITYFGMHARASGMCFML